MNARLAGLALEFLVEEMVADGVAEILVGIKRDPIFGPVLVLASGGVFVELFADSRTVILPAEDRAIQKALELLKAWRLVEGYRGRPAGDADAAISAIQAVVRFAERNEDRLLELDVNPLIVRPLGLGVAAADALIRWVE